MKNWEWKDKITAYFTFSVKERWAVLVLVTIILALFFAPAYFSGPEGDIHIEDSVLSSAIAEIDTAIEEAHKSRYTYSKIGTKSPVIGERFFFDPNTIGISDWIRLGVKEKTALTIQRYQQKGGRFRRAEDLEKIYGLPPALVKQLKPFIQIAAKDSFSVVSRPRPKKNLPIRIMINSADSINWEALPGIGPKLAGRIVNFRKRLGGFYAVQQVAEVYGLEDSVFRKIETFLENDGPAIQLLDLNSSTMEELSAHPYIRKSIANAIVQYRMAHGRFQQLDELTKIHLIRPEQYAKISHYCKVE